MATNSYPGSLRHHLSMSDVAATRRLTVTRGRLLAFACRDLSVALDRFQGAEHRCSGCGPS